MNKKKKYFFCKVRLHKKIHIVAHTKRRLECIHPMPSVARFLLDCHKHICTFFVYFSFVLLSCTHLISWWRIFFFVRTCAKLGTMNALFLLLGCRIMCRHNKYCFFCVVYLLFFESFGVFYAGMWSCFVVVAFDCGWENERSDGRGFLLILIEKSFNF